MKVFVLFVLVFCVHSSFQQQRQQNQNQISSLTYSEADYYPLPPVARSTTTTTTEAPETTTKKKGFFSGFTGLFKSKDKESTTQEPTTTKKSVPTTPAAATQTTSTTPKLPPRSDLPTPPSRLPPKPDTPTPAPSKPQSTPPTPPPRSQQPSSSTTTAPKKTTHDDFPPLPGQQANKPIQVPTQNPSVPNAWGKPPVQAPTPASNPWGKLPTQPPTQVLPNSRDKVPVQPPTPAPNAWGKPPGAATGPAPKPQSFFPQSPQSAPQPSVSSVSAGPVTDAELLTLSESLFSKDIHNPFKFVTVNYQGRTQSSAHTDEASQPLLKIDEKLFALNTVEKMKAMYNNYEQDTAINEYVSPIEKKEEDEFLDAILATPVMRHAMNFLQQKGVVTADPQTHRELLKTIWFNLYSRGMGKIGSSGFEHVFLSEVKNGTVMGLHNWIYLSEAEKTGDLDYKGWTKKIDLGNKGQIAKVRFTLNQHVKPSNSLFIGTSPELEIALYTVCFELRADKECRLAYGGKDFNIVTHSYRYRGKNLIGSAYPEI